MSHDDEDVLAPVDLDAWRVPPPRSADMSTILSRVLSPAAPPARSRITWVVAALAVANVVLAAILVIVLARPATTVTVTAPGASTEPRTQELLGRIEQLESRIAELTEKLDRARQPPRTIPPLPAPVPPSPPTTPDGLERDAVKAGIAAIQSQVNACGDRSTVKGMVKVAVRVLPSGSVSNVEVRSAPDAKLGACVAAAVQKAKFNRSRNGGSFSYPFVLK